MRTPARHGDAASATRREALAILLAASAAVAVLRPAPALAGGFSGLDFGTRRMGMYAVTARPDDPTAIYHNPAGLTLQHGTNLYFGTSVIIGDLNFRLYDSQGKLRPDEGIEPTFNVGATPMLAITSDLGTEDLRVGLGFYAPNGFGAALPEDAPTRYHAVDALFLTTRATFALAYEFTEVLSLAASISAIHVYLGARQMMNQRMLLYEDWDIRFQSPEETAPDDYWLTLDGQDWTWTWDLGAIIRPIPPLRIGVSFSAGSAVTLEGKAELQRVQADPVTGERATVSARHETGMALPFTFRFGLNWEYLPGFEIGLDVVWWHYQVLQEQRTTLSEPLLGMTEMVDAKNYRNGVLWCIGLLYEPLPELELMMGWQMDFSPIPEETYTLQTPARDSYGLTGGIRWQATDSLRVGLALSRIWFELVNVQTSRTKPPTNGKGYGGLTYVSIDAGYTF